MDFIYSFIQKILRFKTENTQSFTGKQVLLRQIALAAGIFLIILLAVFGLMKIGGSTNNKSGYSPIAKDDNSSSKINVEVASNALDPDRMWRNHFEDKLNEAQLTTDAQLKKIAESIGNSSQQTLKEAKDDINELRQQFLEAKEQLEDATNQMREMMQHVEVSKESYKLTKEADVESILIEDEPMITAPKDNKYYIPETSYLEGTLLAGIAVSTSVGSSSEPVPVIIRITGRGNLPKNFSANFEECRVLGSSYGDLSSERAIIRAESLVCENKASEEVTVTKIAGAVYGDDGMNGIKGKVVDMSSKHIKNAALGGLLSGFANGMKSEGQFSISSFGAINTKQQSLDGKLKDNAVSGMGSAAEKIADYYIKQAENMSPVLQVPGGARVDVVFTKGVYLGSSDVVKLIEMDRKKLADQITD